MHKLNAWIIEMNLLTGEFSDQFSALSDAQLNWKPDDNSWSIAQVITYHPCEFFLFWNY